MYLSLWRCLGNGGSFGLDRCSSRHTNRTLLLKCGGTVGGRNGYRLLSLENDIARDKNLVHTRNIIVSTCAIITNTSEDVFFGFSVQCSHVLIRWDEHPAKDAKFLHILEIRALVSKQLVRRHASECPRRSLVFKITSVSKSFLPQVLR